MVYITNGPGTYISKKNTPTISAGAYSAGDVVGGLITLPINAPSQGGRLQLVTLYDLAKIKAALTVHLFRQAPATIADNAAFALSDADLPKHLGSLSTGTYLDMPSNAAVFIPCDIPYVGDTLYLYLVAVATPTYTLTGGLIVRATVKN